MGEIIKIRDQNSPSPCRPPRSFSSHGHRDLPFHEQPSHLAPSSRHRFAIPLPILIKPPTTTRTNAPPKPRDRPPVLPLLLLLLFLLRSTPQLRPPLTSPPTAARRVIYPKTLEITSPSSSFSSLQRSTQTMSLRYPYTTRRRSAALRRSRVGGGGTPAVAAEESSGGGGGAPDSSSRLQ